MEIIVLAICWRLSAFKSPSHEKSIFLKNRSFFSFKFFQGHNWLTNYPDSEFHGHWKTVTLSSISLNLSKHWRFLAFWLSLCFGSFLLFLVCHDTAFLFSTRAMTALGWLPNAHRDMIILVRPKMCRPSANNENSRRTREKPLVPRVLLAPSVNLFAAYAYWPNATARRKYCKWILLFKKKYQPRLCSFILLRARYFAMTSCKDLLLITKKIEMTLHSIMESISHLGKMARTSAKSENPNEAEVIS